MRAFVLMHSRELSEAFFFDKERKAESEREKKRREHTKSFGMIIRRSGDLCQA